MAPAPIATFYGSMQLSEVVARSARAVVVLSQIRAYRSGCVLGYTAAALRDPDVEPHAELKAMFFSGDTAALPGFEIRFGDGTRAVAAEEGRLPGAKDRPEPPVLFVLTGATATSGDHVLEFRHPLWLWPLPPAETFGMAITWPRYDIAEVHTIDGARIRELAAQSRQFWDD